MNPKSHPLRAFTLIELLIVIAVIAILTALVTPAFNKTRDTANATKCANNLKQIGNAMFSFAGENNVVFPISGATVPYNTTDSVTGQYGWTQQLEKYLPTAGGTDLRIFQCPTTSNLYSNSKYYSYFNGGHAAYVAASGSFSAVRQILIQYPSKFILAGDISNNSFAQNDADKDDFTAASPGPAFSGNMSKMHSGKSNILFADGHVTGFTTFDYTKPAGTAGTDSDSRSLTVWYDQIADYNGNQ